MRELLENAGATVVMSRLSNNPTVYKTDEAGNIVTDEDGVRLLSIRTTLH